MDPSAFQIFHSKDSAFSVGEKSVVQKREAFDGEGQGLDQMGASGENVSGSVAAFVTTGGQNINIIHGTGYPYLEYDAFPLRIP